MRDSCGLLRDPLARSCVIRFFARGRDAITDSDGRRDLGIGSKETDGSWSSSLTSLIVNAAWVFVRIYPQISAYLKYLLADLPA